MIYKFNNGGIVKLQNAWTTMPTFEDAWKNSEQQRQWQKKVEEAEKKASERIDNEDKGFLANMRFSGETGEWSKGANLKARMAKYTAEELGLDGNKAFMDSYINDGKQGAIAFGSTLLAAPMAGEFATYGLLGGAARLAGGMAGSAVGSYALGKAGELGDRTFGTTWMKPAGQIIGGFAGWGPGSNIAYKGTLDLASVAPKIARIGTTDRFIGDVAGRALGKSIKNGNLTVGPLRHALKSNLTPNHSNFGVSEYELFDTLTGKSIGKLGTTFDIRQNKIGIPHVDNIIGTEGTKGVSRSLYNAALIDNPSGLVSGESLIHPEITESVWKHFPYKVISKNGIRPNNTHGAIVDLNTAETFVPTLTENKVIPFTPIPQKPVSTIDFDPRVKPLSRPLSRPISEAERLGIPKGERSNPKALEDPYYWGYKQWNSRYNAAVESGNIEEAQRLRALHFITKAPNTKVIEATEMPKEVYHGSQQKFTVFDSSKTRPDYNYGTSTNMFSDNKNVALGYANNDPDKLHSVYLNLQNILERDFKGNPWDGSVNNSGKFQIVPEFGTIYSSKQEAETALQKILDQYYPNNPAKQAEQRHHMYVFELMDPPHPERSTNAFSDEITNTPTLDGGIVKNVKDYYDLPIFDENPELYKELTSPHTDYFVKDPRNIKSSAIITYDDSGRIIPIVKRDNFHNPDVRYKQGGILKAQHGFDLSRLNWTDISNHILGFAADVRNKINKMNRYTPEMVPVIGTDSLKTERRGKIGPLSMAKGKDPKIVENGGIVKA